MSEHTAGSDAHLTCSAEDCGDLAVETLFIRNQIGHVHDCSAHSAQLREWCDVIHGEPIVGGECMAVVCTTDPIHFGQPTPLDPRDTPPGEGRS